METLTSQTKPHKAEQFEQGDLVTIWNVQDKVFFVKALHWMGATVRSGVEQCMPTDGWWYELSDGSFKSSDELDLAE